MLVDDRASTVSLPEVPLLGVLPGTGGLTRLVDKRHVRRDLADAFATKTEGLKGQQARGLGPRRRDRSPQRVRGERSASAPSHARPTSDRPDGGAGIELTPLDGGWSDDGARYDHVARRRRSRARDGDDHGERTA